MKLLRKIFCRMYQNVFHLALPLLPYREPIILKSTDEIGPEIKKKGIDSALVITDEFLQKSGAAKGVELSLLNNGIKFVVYGKTRPNPTVYNVEEALAIYKEHNCQCIIAFGGGSTIDCAKAVGARVVYPKCELDKLKGNLKIFRKLPVLFAVPTTAGTGSEVTLTAVITDPEKKHKYTINAFPLIPSYAVLDPVITYTLPQSITATTGMDALTHAVEAYIGRSTSKETRQLSKDAVKLILENIETAFSEPENYVARENMLKAAYKAGIALSKSYVGYIHAVAHSLGGWYNVPHGLANAVLLPKVLEAYGACVYKKLKDLAVYSAVADENDIEQLAAEKFIDRIKELNVNMNIPEFIPEIKEEDITDMAKKADAESNPLYPVPVLLNAKELEKFYYMVAEWSQK